MARLKFSNYAENYSTLPIATGIKEQLLLNCLSGGTSSTPEKIKDNGSGSAGIFARPFAYSLGAVYSMFFDIALPSDWKPGTNLTPFVRWIVGTTLAEGNRFPNFNFEYAWINQAGTLGNSSLWSTIKNASPDEFLIAYKEYTTRITDGGDGVIVGTGKTAGSILHCRLARNCSVDDSYPYKIYPIAFYFTYERQRE